MEVGPPVMTQLPPTTTDYQLSDRYTRDTGTVFVTGIQALARLPLEQLRDDRRKGLHTAAFVSGYPGSPLGGYDGAIAKASVKAPDLPIVCRPALNEEYAATAVMGSQLAMAQPDARYDGVLGVWYGKAPGVDRATDALRHAVYAGASNKGGAIALVGDDPAAKSSTVPSSSAGALADMHMPLLYPGDPAEALDLGRHAIALSRATGLWAALKIVADVADGSATVDLDLDRVDPVIPLLDGRPYNRTPDGHLLTPATLDIEREIYEVRYQLAIQYASANRLNRPTANPVDAWFGIVASGITYREVREAFARLGLTTDADIESLGVRLLKMQMPIPFNPETIRRFSRGLEEVFVIEEKQPNLESLIKDALYALPDRPQVTGKHDQNEEPLLPGHGALTADLIIPALRTRLESRVGHRLAPPTPSEQREPDPLKIQRTPFYCSGCPHNRSTEVPAESLVGAGIGCHTMALLMDENRVGDIAGITAMGNEGTQWVGMAEFVERDHFFQNLGDGTFFHSGQLAVQAAVAAGVSITYKLLYNGAVAMTGGQHPQGQATVADVSTSLLAQGVKKIVVTTDEPDRYRTIRLPDGVAVRHRRELVEAQKQLQHVKGVTVLIHDQQCAAEARRARKRGLAVTPSERVLINPRVCEGCGDCGQVSNCLSVQPVDTFFGLKTKIDQTTCNYDYSCLEGDCPSFVTVDTASPGRFERSLYRLLRRDRTSDGNSSRERGEVNTTTKRHQPPADLRSPSAVVPEDNFAMRITGIGGTGVITVSQIIGTAAMLDGFSVRGLDQIGLSQKAGPVVSDLRLSRHGKATTNRLGQGQADLLLAFDPLVGASEKGRLTASRDRTTVVGSTSQTPTGEMIGHPNVELPSHSALAMRLAEVSRLDQQHWADATGITSTLFGDATTANIFVVGMAVQAGCLPVSAEAIEKAIELNSVAVEANRNAFRWGRTQIAEPDAVATCLRDLEAKAPPRESAVTPLRSNLRRMILDVAEGDKDLTATLTRYASELVLFQDVSYAEDYLKFVSTVADRERAHSTYCRELTDAVAANLYKLMAYKDEYEVARLLLDRDANREVESMAGTGGRIGWHLHPPALRALGLSWKIRLGMWSRPLMILLRAMKSFRGTPFDLFGRAQVRCVERALPGEYRDAITRATDTLNAERIDRVVEIARLPEMVRGFENIKLENVRRYRGRLSELLAGVGV